MSQTQFEINVSLAERIEELERQLSTVRTALTEYIAAQDAHTALLKDPKSTREQFIESRDRYSAARARIRTVLS